MKFRTTLAALAAVTMLGGLAACGGGDDEADTAAPPANTAPEAPPADNGSDAPPAAGDASITMLDNSFEPAELTVPAGTTISITNEGQARHDLIDKADPAAFDSGDISGGASGMVTAPSEAGTYDYKCTYHFGMEGVLTVS